MPFQVTVLYEKPADPLSFDRHYAAVHARLTAALPGLIGYTVSRPGYDAMGREAPYYLVGCLTFADENRFVDALGSSEGARLLADLQNLRGSDVTIMTGPSEHIV